MKLEYDGETYIVEQVTGDIYRAYTPTKGVCFTVEWKLGTHFNFRSAYIGNRTYSAHRYSYRWMGLIREASFLIAKTDGIFSYAQGNFKKLVYSEAEDKMVWITI